MRRGEAGARSTSLNRTKPFVVRLGDPGVRQALRKGSDMAYRPSWQGYLKLSLVTCPVALYTATNAGGDVHFNLINPATNNRIKMTTIDPDTGPIERSALVKGYEVSKGEYILLTDEEIKSVKLESTKTIDIERFVAGDQIDRLYWDNPYYLAPDGKLAVPRWRNPARSRSGASLWRRASASSRSNHAARASSPTRSARMPRSASPTRSSPGSATSPPTLV